MRNAFWMVAVIGLGCPGGSDAFRQDFVDACMASSNMGQPICDCMAQKAEDELTENERTFVLAALQDDEKQTERLRGELGLDGAMRAGMFMTGASSCALNQVNP